MEPLTQPPFHQAGEREAQRSSYPVALALAMAGAIAVVAGSFGPWAILRTFLGDISKQGTDGDGIITVALGLGVCALLAFHAAGRLGRWSTGVSMFLMGLAAAIGIYDWWDVSTWTTGVESELASSSVGWGLQLVTIGAFWSAVFLLVHIVRENPGRSVEPGQATRAAPWTP